MEKITIDDLKKIEIKIGKILSAEPIEGSEKLLKLSVDMGLKMDGSRDIRQILSGIAKYYPGGEGLVGLKCSFVSNLEPRMMMGLESNGMLLAVSGESDDKEFFSPLMVSDDVLPGTSVR
jgi:methionyl-tRNA synthetase